jgi:hypothetical protein
MSSSEQRLLDDATNRERHTSNRSMNGSLDEFGLSRPGRFDLADEPELRCGLDRGEDLGNLRTEQGNDRFGVVRGHRHEYP